MIKNLINHLLKRRKRKKRALFTIWIVFIITLIILMFIFYLTIPTVQNIITELIKGGETILKQNQQPIQGIQNDTIRETLINVTNNEIQSLTEQQTILASFVQYAWIIIIIVVMLIVYILARQSVETSMIR